MKAKKTIRTKKAIKSTKQKFAFAAPVAAFTAIMGKITTFFK